MSLVKHRFVPLLLVAVALTTALAGSTRRPAVKVARQQQPERPVGVWKGTSVCLQGKPVCKDEVVVYHIAAVPTRPGHYATLMNKIVEGREEGMGALDCRFDPATRVLNCPMPASRRPGTWRFRLMGNLLEGELLVPDGTTFRRIHVARVD